MEKITVKSKFSTRQMAMVGMLSAISIFLGLTGLGFIPIPPVKATIMHLPVIIGAIIEGPIVGVLVGSVFGLFSMYQAFTTPLPTSFIFWNPIIALLPRILIGVVSYYVYVFCKKYFKKQSLSIGVSAVLGTLTNTIGVMGLTYVIYLEKYAQALGISTTAAKIGIGGVIVTNGSIEAIVSAVISIPVVLTLIKIKKM
ncbi:ECF transporter S component [Clostridium weizhouense]|uniref:ECF transporter S component n=1 Tax=Clostridium weizhouense TaxID=2859781 RepID=A0ABS7AKL6_9CLOT|nr:ECF transporter S component [Clostridium weizhouense]MBW6408643.1 ECF transporter S component [Clostridium weizhouense]